MQTYIGKSSDFRIQNFMEYFEEEETPKPSGVHLLSTVHYVCVINIADVISNFFYDYKLRGNRRGKKRNKTNGIRFVKKK